MSKWGILHLLRTISANVSCARFGVTYYIYEKCACEEGKPLSIVLIHLVSYLLRSLDPLRRERDRRLWLPLRERFDLKQKHTLVKHVRTFLPLIPIHSDLKKKRDGFVFQLAKSET